MDKGNLTQFDAVTILICRIIALGFEHFPTRLNDVWPFFLALLIFYLILNLISTHIVLKLKCNYPKLK